METQSRVIQLQRIRDQGQATESLAQMWWRRFRRHRFGLISLLVALILVLSAVLAPVIRPEGYSRLNPANRLKPPNEQYLLGTDAIGRDIFSRLLYGGQISLSIALVGVSISFVIGITAGAVSGYYGGWVDTIIQRIVEIIGAMPAFIIILSFVAVYGPNIYNTMIILGLFGWTGLCRFVRGQVLQVREMDYVLASRSLGSSSLHIIFRHILPNVAPDLACGEWTQRKGRIPPRGARSWRAKERIHETSNSKPLSW